MKVFGGIFFIWCQAICREEILFGKPGDSSAPDDKNLLLISKVVNLGPLGLR